MGVPWVPINGWLLQSTGHPCCPKRRQQAAKVPDSPRIPAVTEIGGAEALQGGLRREVGIPGSWPQIIEEGDLMKNPWEIIEVIFWGVRSLWMFFGEHGHDH